ncbi:MAG: MFS transporter [Candidatus Kerfeldbacteria bacterium]
MKLREGVLKALPILGHGNFLKLWSSQILNQSAGHILNFALAVRIFEISHSSTLVGVLVAVVSVPPILFSSLAGAMADRFDRKTILFLSNILRALVVVVFFACGDSPAALIVLGFIISAISQFFGPAESATIPELVPRTELFIANAMFVSTVYIAFLIGYSIAGPLIQLLGPTKVYAILFFAFLVSAALNAILPRLTGHLEHRIKTIEFFRNLKGEIRDGVRFIRHTPIILMLVVQFSLVFGFERSVVALIPALATNVLGFNVQQMSLFLILPAGLGAAIGAFVGNIAKRRWKKSTLIISGIVGAGVTLCLIPFVNYLGNPDVLVVHDVVRLWYIMALVFLTGFADVLIIVAAQTTFHEETPGHTRGRVFGSLITLMNLVGLPMILIVSWLGEHYPIMRVFFGIGIAMILLAFLSVRQNRKINSVRLD